MRYRPFEDLYSEILFEQAYVLEEKYLKYTPPQDKEALMYDFYILSYLKYLLTQPSKQFRDLPEDIEDSVNDAVATLYPYLRQELLQATFYAVCAEMRHLTAKSSNYNLFKDGTPTENKKYREMMTHYVRYMKHKTMKDENRSEAEILFPDNPSSRVRGKEGEESNAQERNNSFKAAHYAIKKTGSTPSDFIKMAQEAFTNGAWFSSYGGPAWANICKGYLRLARAEKINPNAGQDTGSSKKKSQGEDMGVAIDHVYDLQHNTDTVFNKLNTYLKDGNYRWLKKALDHKANVKSYYELLPMASGTVKSLTPRVLYNKLGSTWEKDTQYTSPKKETFPDNDLDTDSPEGVKKLMKAIQDVGNLPKVGDTVTSPHTTETWDVYDVYHDGDELMLKLKSNKNNDILSVPYEWSSLEQMGYKIKNSAASNVPIDYPQVGAILTHPDTSDKWEITDVIEQSWGTEVKLKDAKAGGKEHGTLYSWTSLKNQGYELSQPTKDKTPRPTKASSSGDVPKVGDIITSKYDKNEKWKVEKTEPDENGLLLSIKNLSNENSTNKYYWEDLKNAGYSFAPPSSEEIPEVGDYFVCDGDKYEIIKVVPLYDGDYEVYWKEADGEEDNMNWNIIKTWDCKFRKKNKKQERKPSKNAINIGDTIYATSGFGPNPVSIDILDSQPAKGVYVANITDAETTETLETNIRLNKQLLDKMVKDGVWHNMGVQI